MKVGTDAVLLGVWAGTGDRKHILDIGTGSGIIALMMAQRHLGAKVLGIDIHHDSVKQAKENFNFSPWGSRLSARHISLQEYSARAKREFDLIVSNPPYFKDSLLPPDSSRKAARHNTFLSFEDLIRCSVSILKDNGSLALILPYDSKILISCIMEKYKLYLLKEVNIIPVRGKEPNRFLSEWSREKTYPERNELTIRVDPRTYTEEYRELSREFYLAL